MFFEAGLRLIFISLTTRLNVIPYLKLFVVKVQCRSVKHPTFVTEALGAWSGIAETLPCLRSYNSKSSVQSWYIYQKIK